MYGVYHCLDVGLDCFVLFSGATLLELGILLLFCFSRLSPIPLDSCFSMHVFYIYPKRKTREQIVKIGTVAERTGMVDGYLTANNVCIKQTPTCF